MGGFITRRVLVTIPVVFCALSLLFFLFFLVPGDPVDTLAGGAERAVSESVRHNIEEKYGFNDPVPVQFANYWKRTATGDLGQSYKTSQSVNDIVKRTAVASARLAFWAIMIEILIGIS